MSNNDRLIWEKRIKEYKDSGLSGAQWCRENNLSYHAFKYWHYKISDKLRNKEYLKQNRERIFDKNLLKEIMRTLSELC
ncbi:IS66 family insertion sequence element accessory protein TnpA [Paramaledivibacter caminithermalis]|jgi:hypothetical protein|uniref:Transposase n=1 Tax=Paramaledivibacter caminithermalis (strain DSM 15212 / CIP 107654 / DViRD3) TaxID=1121301 RepID=A0A1M6TUN3_PARC5|nr:hypothetical protein [Paramaledivibacter caminithermalis]SHK60651.1 hypothetical protein SAMN02745912_03799 [Paramaledivibacter caminithermalis DSM 15212]